MMDDIKHYHDLKSKLQKRNKSLKENLIDKHSEAFMWATNNIRQISAGAMGSLLLLSAPNMSLLQKPDNNMVHEQFVDVPENMFVISDIKQYLPDEVGSLTLSQEDAVARILSSYYGMNVASQENGLRLNTAYGYMGAEQHLMRYPGDTMDSHFQTAEEAALVGRSGMAPGRGAYGYFAKSKSELTQKEIDREKYYIAVQTFMAPGYMERTREYVNFFKFKKMLVVNPNNGRAMVVVIGDAGPAVWTKKHLGGSPEVMKHLERVDGSQKGAVLYFFIDDPEDKIPLGPVDPVTDKLVASI